MNLRQLAQTRLHVMDISGRGYDALKSANLKTFGDLARADIQTLGNSYAVRDIERAVTDYVLGLIKKEAE